MRNFSIIVEYRDLDGTVIHYEEPEFSETTGKKLHKIVDKAGNLSQNSFTSSPAPNTKLEVVAIDFAGNILKTTFWKTEINECARAFYHKYYLHFIKELPKMCSMYVTNTSSITKYSSLPNNRGVSNKCVVAYNYKKYQRTGTSNRKILKNETGYIRRGNIFDKETILMSKS